MRTIGSACVLVWLKKFRERIRARKSKTYFMLVGGLKANGVLYGYYGLMKCSNIYAKGVWGGETVGNSFQPFLSSP